jgi:flagellar hook assembly protein FlgD
LALGPAQPNPFGASTVAQLRLGEAAQVRLAVFDLRGRLVREIFAGRVAAGTRAFSWDGRDAHGAPAASGIYFLRVLSGDDLRSARSQRVVLLR